VVAPSTDDVHVVQEDSIARSLALLLRWLRSGGRRVCDVSALTPPLSILVVAVGPASAWTAAFAAGAWAARLPATSRCQPWASLEMSGADVGPRARARRDRPGRGGRSRVNYEPGPSPRSAVLGSRRSSGSGTQRVWLVFGAELRHADLGGNPNAEKLRPHPASFDCPRTERGESGVLQDPPKGQSPRRLARPPIGRARNR